MAPSQNDLLDLFRLEAVVTDKCTTHIEYKTDRARGIRNERVEKKWYRKQCVGSGGFGEVWLEVTQEDDIVEKRAVKILNKTKIRSRGIDYNKELLALAKFSKQEEVLVKFFGWFEDSSSLFLSMEYFELGDLEQYITAPITEDEVKDITTDILNGLRIMHSENFAHRDLKPGNIFVVQKPPASKWWVKIGDFGIAKRAQRDETALRTVIGTPSYQAPEVTGDFNTDEQISEYDNAVDIWSLGCVIYKIATMSVPFKNSWLVVEFCTGRKAFPEQPLLAKMSLDGVKFVRMLIVPNPQERLSAEKALKEPWLLQRKHNAVLEAEELAECSIPTVTQTSFNATGLVTGEMDSHRDPVEASTDSTILNQKGKHSVSLLQTPSDDTVRPQPAQNTARRSTLEDQAFTLHLHYSSFRDFIKDKSDDSSFWVDEKQAHWTFAHRCIQFLPTALRQDICGLGLDAPGVLVSNMQSSQVEECLPPEVQYACLHWVEHLQKSGVQIYDNDQIHQFLLTHLLHWIEALSWMKKITEGILAIMALMSIASVSLLYPPIRLYLTSLAD
jgi:serine/threonine protein kinase